MKIYENLLKQYFTANSEWNKSKFKEVKAKI
jgi:hypothetical protein